MPSPQQTSTTPVDIRDEWRTPPFVFEYVKRRQWIDVDLAASHQNALLGVYLTRDDDALQQDWSRIGNAGWCNPPYSGVDPWLEKAIDEATKGFTTVMLLPAPNGEDRYGRFVLEQASEIIFITGRLAFIDHTGSPRSGNNRGSIIATYRGYDMGCTRIRSVFRDEMKAIVDATDEATA